MQPFTPAIAKAVQSDENVINVDIENYDPEITLGTYSVELRDLNNNLLDQSILQKKPSKFHCTLDASWEKYMLSRSAMTEILSTIKK